MHARRFTGESDAVRQAAIQALRRDPTLAEQLRRALGTNDHFLALDVISVLRLRTFQPTLLKFAEKDKTGYSYHVINSIVAPSEIADVGKLYVERLQRPGTTAAAKVALLDSLGRMQIELGVDAIRAQLGDGTPEVRSAVLYYTRTALLKWKKAEYLALLEPALRDATYQIRAQALFLVQELPERTRTMKAAAFRKLLGPCQEDPVADVKSLCREMMAKLPSGGAA